MRRVIGLGLVLSAAAGLVSGVAWGWQGVVAAVTLGLVATAIQAGATRLMLRRRAETFEALVKARGAGMALRMGGVLLMVILVLVDRALFAPLPSALGFLGVLIPLLVIELKMVGAG